MDEQEKHYLVASYLVWAKPDHQKDMFVEESMLSSELRQDHTYEFS
jgi:hypothetical protein